MPLDSENLVRLLHVNEISKEQIYWLAGRTYQDFQPRDRNELADWVVVNRDSPDINKSLKKEDLIESFKRGEDALNKSNEMGFRTISRFDPDFPALLKKTPYSPLIINTQGNVLPLNSHESIAVVGSRESSGHGRFVAGRLGSEMAESGVNVISGLALGIDTAAHMGSLKVGGVTTAVLAHGLDTVYPKENERLANSIVEGGGLLLSEYLIGKQPEREAFIERDRIVAGLSKATIVVETSGKGGTMQTAKYAMDFGRMLGVYYDSNYKDLASAAGNVALLNNDGVILVRSKSDLKYIIDSHAWGLSNGFRQKI